MAELDGELPPEDGEELEQVSVAESEEFCFVCKDGGDLMLCNYRNCPKAYHPSCVGEKKSSLKSGEHWNCVWHSCSNCANSSNLCCYTCPESVCNSCVDPEFLHIKGGYGLCRKCVELALVVEDIMMRESKGEKTGVEVVDKKAEHFKEYYEFVKKRESFSLDNPISEKGLEMKNMYKRSSNSDDAVFDHFQVTDNDIDLVVNNGISVEDKRCEGPPKREYNHVEAFADDVVMRSRTETPFASIIPENIRLVYLTKSLVMELLKQPESLESKVEGNFVRVKSSLFGDCQSNSYQLLQVVGITKDLSGSNPVKLQLLNMPDDVCIDSLSDAPFSEEECEDLRQKVEVGLLNKPTVEELEDKARGLHHDLMTHMIAKEKKDLQSQIDRANEKGRRDQLAKYLERRQLLESESEVMRLLNTPPKVIAEVPKVKPDIDDTTDDRKRKRSVPDLLPTSIEDEDSNKTLEHKVKDGHHDAGSLRFTPTKDNWLENEAISDADEKLENMVRGVYYAKSSLVGVPMKVKRQEKKRSSGITRTFSDDIVVCLEATRTFSGDTGCVKQGEIPSKSCSNGNEVPGSKISSGRTVSNFPASTPECPVTGNSLDDAALNEILDELIKPSDSNHPVCLSPEGVERMEKGYILCLKSIPISSYKDTMIPVANGLFASLRSLNIDYTQLYGHVKDYIRCSARLANTENTKGRPSVQELNANYESKRLRYDKDWEALKEMSTFACESNMQLGEGHNEAVLSIIVKMIEDLEKSKNGMQQALYALDKLTEKRFKEEQMKNDFLQAKDAL